MSPSLTVVAAVEHGAAARRFRRLAAALAVVAGLAAMPAPAAQRPYDLPPEQLAPGDFQWFPEAAPAGPLLLVVSLPQQRAYLYRNGLRIAVSTVSTGRPGYETPPGVFTILQKHREHYSNLYDNAPMPFMQRLTWSGVALHAGRLPGYPDSHGCVRLPREFAERLFATTALGMTVVVAGGAADVPGPANPGWLAPPVPRAGEGAAAPVAGPDIVSPADATFFWAPERAPDGPMTILLGLADRSVRVLRDGVEIGRSAFVFDGDVPAGTVVLQLQAGTRPEPSRTVPDRPALNWTRIDVDAGADAAAPALDARYAGVRLAPGFARQVYDELVPGTTVVLTDLPIEPTTSAEPLLDTEPAREAAPASGAAADDTRPAPR
jgi:hypothetical protein